MRTETLRMLDQSLHPSVYSRGKIRMRDRVADKMGGERRRGGKMFRNESPGEGGSSLGMKLSPQVCLSDTISGRVFHFSYK